MMSFNLDLQLKKKVPVYEPISRREKSESEFIPYTCHYDENTILTKSGDLLQILKIEGLPFETADDDFLAFRKDLRNTMLRSIAKSQYAVYVHTVRRKHNVYPAGEFSHGFSNDLNQAWKRKQEKLDLYVNDLYLTIYQKANSSNRITGFKGWFNSLTKKIDKNQVNIELQLDHKELIGVTNRFLSSLKDYGARLLGIQRTEKGSFSESIQFFNQLINLQNHSLLLPQMDLSKYLGSKRIFFGKDALEVRGINGNNKLGAILSIKEYASESEVGILDVFLELPIEFIITQSFIFTDRHISLGKIQTQQRKMLQTEDLAISQIEQIDQALDDATSGKIGFGYHHLTILVTAENSKNLDKAIALAESTFLDLGIVAVREDLNLEPCFWAQLPGNFSSIARSSMISTANFASFASLHNYPCGRVRSNHWGPAVTLLETTSGTPYFFNFHLNDVGHTAIIGPTGTGKSVLLNFLLAQCFKFKPKIFFFDKDRGGEIFIRAMKGAHSTLGISHPSGFNPLKLPDTPENRAFLTEWLQILLSSFKKDSSEEVSAAELHKIQEAIEGNYRLEQLNRTLEHIAPFFGIGGPDSLAGRLKLWYGNGTHSNLFGNKEDVLKFDQPLYGFEMGEILEDKKGLPAILSYLFHRINTELNGKPTIIVLEEGWKLLDNPFFAPKIKDWLQTIRKRNGFVIFLTPNIESAIKSSIGDALVQQCSTFIFLPNHKATSEYYCDVFKLSEREYELIRTMDPASRCFLIKHGQDSIVAKLNLSGMEEFIRILSGTSKSVSLLDSIRKEVGDNPDQWIPLFQERMKSL